MTADQYDLSRSQWEHLIDEWIFSERDRAILKDRLLNGMIFEKLAEKYDLSTQRIKEIVYKSQKKLFRHL